MPKEALEGGRRMDCVSIVDRILFLSWHLPPLLHPSRNLIQMMKRRMTRRLNRWKAQAAKDPHAQ